MASRFSSASDMLLRFLLMYGPFRRLHFCPFVRVHSFIRSSLRSTLHSVLPSLICAFLQSIRHYFLRPNEKAVPGLLERAQLDYTLFFRELAHATPAESPTPSEEDLRALLVRCSYVYVCLYLCVCVCVRACVCTCVCAFVRVCTCVCMRVRVTPLPPSLPTVAFFSALDIAASITCTLT